VWKTPREAQQRGVGGDGPIICTFTLTNFVLFRRENFLGVFWKMLFCGVNSTSFSQKNLQYQKTGNKERRSHVDGVFFFFQFCDIAQVAIVHEYT
jgi:hypothetical protein